MDKMNILNKIKMMYEDNKNIIKYLKEIDETEVNSIEDIMISYDFQAGSYIQWYKNNPEFQDVYCHYLANVIDNLGIHDSILEVGIGEGTTFGPLWKSLINKPDRCFGFDISWSRIKYANSFMNQSGINNIQLFTGDLFCTPIKNSSIDIVYTSHSIEPNGGKEKEALTELYRIANKYLVLLEPSFEFANEEAKKRMTYHGYVTKLYETVKELGYNVIEHRLFEISDNPLNPTGLIIIKKDAGEGDPDPLCCPITKTNIMKKDNTYFSQESLLAYPIIGGIPCLLPQNAVVATKFLD